MNEYYHSTENERYDRTEECFAFLRDLMQMAQNPLYSEECLTKQQKLQLAVHMKGAATDLIGLVSDINLTSTQEVLDLVIEDQREPVELKEWYLLKISDKDVKLKDVARRAWSLMGTLEIALRRMSRDKLPESSDQPDKEGTLECNGGFRKSSVTIQVELSQQASGEGTPSGSGNTA